LKDETVDAIVSVSGVSEEFERQDIEEALASPSEHFDRPYNKISEKEFREYVSDGVLRSQSFKVFFLLEDASRFPSSYELGTVKLLDAGELPAEVQDFLSKGKGVGQTKADYIPVGKFLWAGGFFAQPYVEVEVQAYGLAKAATKAAKVADEALNVIRFEYEQPFTLPEYCIVLDKTNNVSLKRMAAFSGATYVAEMDKMTGELNEVLNKKNPTELENRLRNAVRLYGLAIEASRPEIKFTLLTNALEGLLMNKGEDIRVRLAEKVSFLTEVDKESRRSQFEQVRELYDRRSDFVHQNKTYQPIRIDEAAELAAIFHNVFLRLLELRNDGYESIRKVVDKEGKVAGKAVDDLVDDLKFA
jgi:Apea-like HEPN